jgi:membrane protease YdiL (CAAX protease family)
MQPTVLPALPATPRPLPAYPTLRESWAVVGWYLLATLVAGGGCYALLSYATPLPRIQSLMFSTVAANVGLLLFLRWKAGSRWQPWQLAGQARAWHLALLPVVVVAAQLVLSLLDFLHLPNSMEKNFERFSHSIGVALLVGGLLVPILEELLFRGVLLTGLLRNQRPWAAIGQSALLFGLIHFNPAQSVSAALLGLLLGWLYYRTRSLGLCIGLHALNNSIGFAALHWAPASWQHVDSIAELFPSAAYYTGAVLLSAAGLAAYVRGVARSTRVG